MGPTWDLSAPDGPHIGPMNLAIRDVIPGKTEVVLHPYVTAHKQNMWKTHQDPHLNAMALEDDKTCQSHRGGTDYGDCSYRARTTPLG